MVTPRDSVPGVARAAEDVYRQLLRLDLPVFVVHDDAGVGVTIDPGLARRARVLTGVPALPPESLGDPAFRDAYGLARAYCAGSMAYGIASADMVIALAKAGYFGSFGAGGPSADKIDTALRRIAFEIPSLPFGCNLLHSPNEPAMERTVAQLCLRHRVRCVEASAFVEPTSPLVHYRAAGLVKGDRGEVFARNRVIAKVSRVEVAEKFMRPAPQAMLRQLVETEAITEEQAEWAGQVPLADDVTAEADSGGHTDRRPLVVLLPELIALRDRIQREKNYAQQVRVGAAGGIGTPAAAAAAFALGAAYVVTGSINQACVEAEQSAAVKNLLAVVESTDCAMASCADMFEMGVEVQVVKRGTMFAGRSKRLYAVYREYNSIESIPESLRIELEQRIFRRRISEIWPACQSYFGERDLSVIRRAESDPKYRMALIFRWYLGLSVSWAVLGVPERAADYQIHCGPAMGAFNAWAAGTYLAAPANRHVAEVAAHMMLGAAFESRVNQLRLVGVKLPAESTTYRPSPLASRAAVGSGSPT